MCRLSNKDVSEGLLCTGYQEKVHTTTCFYNLSGDAFLTNLNFPKFDFENE